MASIIDPIRETTLGLFDRLAGYETATDCPAPSLSLLLDRVEDADLEPLLRDAAAIRSEFDAIIAAGAGVVAKRSELELGYAGLAQRTGHRTPVAMVQSLTGSTRTEAARQVKLGEAMGAADAATHGAIDASPDSSLVPEPDGAVSSVMRVVPWYEPLTRAVAEHRLKSEAVTPILRGLGEPTDTCSIDSLRAAADELLQDSVGVNADELGRRARMLRDRIDPEGVARRFTEHYEQRSWRFSRNESGMRTAWVQFDDESAAWIDAIVSSALSPRRGGPRFVDPDDVARAQQLVGDPRTNDQLVFDLLIDTLRAGSQADPSTIFGSRQPGVRVVIAHDQLASQTVTGQPDGTGFFEETGAAVPARLIRKQTCDAGTRTVLTDSGGNPLDVGRDQRLFTSTQRVALAIRDGGCEFPGCDRPPSFCEAHHINEWAKDGGGTDLADGILFCRHHHMLSHNNGWTVTRHGSAYRMIPPKNVDLEQRPIKLESKSALRVTWQDPAPTGTD
ncbi:hypothetical protein IWX78_002806 [Mycetocola sp. CAN_C7]|uniref:HNH endonuclease signature motif containing protein n=1 Tax=Mycetocola sp. CAN_C7 TaxID=2787724 RepID=UPI0018C92536